MKNFMKKHFLMVLFFLSLSAAALTSLYGGTAFQINKSVSTYNQPYSLSDGWYYWKDGIKSAVPSLPSTIQNDDLDSLTIYHPIPESLPDGAALCIETYYQSLEAFIDGTLVYEYGTVNKAPVGQILANTWNVIDLHPGDSGKLLSLHITAPYTPGEWKIADILIGEKNVLLEQLWRSCISIIVFAMFAGILGLFFLISTIFFDRKNAYFDRQGFFYLGLFILISTLWIISDSKLPQLLHINNATCYLASFLSFTLLPVPFLLYLRQLVKHGHKLLNILSCLFMLESFLYIGLYLSGTADFVTTLPFTHILIAVSIIIILVLCLWEQIYYRNYNMRYILAGICVLTMGAMASLISFTPKENSDNSRFFRYGLLIFYILLCISTLKKYVSLLRTSMQAETYRTLAYTDTMTGFGNRTAFDLDSQKIQHSEKPVPISLAVFDINNLKYINDTYGHTFGDTLIKTASQRIQEIFLPLGSCYRIGGDEFVVIMRKITEKRAHEALLQFQKSLDCHNTGNPCDLDIAYGFAVGNISDSNSFLQLFREADKKMYTLKRKKDARDTS